MRVATAISPGAVWESVNIPRACREARNQHAAAVLWLTGFSGSGKSTLARALEARLFVLGCQTALLDGDQLRHGLCGDLGFAPSDRAENIRRVSHVAHLFLEHGSLVLCAFVSPFRHDRELARKLIGPDNFFEIFVNCPLDECRRRDPKGLYAAARAGRIANFTGLSQPYEPPLDPAFTARTDRHSPPELAAQLESCLRARGWLPA